MLRADLDAHGFTIAVCTCDVCGFETSVKAQHNRHRGNVSKREVVESQVLVKLQSQGWTYIKKTLRCASCEEERKKTYSTKQVVEKIMAEATTETRQPTREQKRQIMALLDDVYDTKAGRYTGGETDKTVADTLGAGIMPGWVAEIREEFFGADGGNDDLTELLAELAKWKTDAEKLATDCNATIKDAIKLLNEFNATRQKVTEFETRLNKLKKAVGPKAEHV